MADESLFPDPREGFEIAEDGQGDELALQPMALEDIKRVMAEAGRGALTDEEYQMLEDAKRVERFSPGAWNENLLDKMTEDERQRIASEMWKWVHWDEASRKPWQEREQAGIRMMGVTDEAELPPENLRFDGMSQVVHPGFVQACIEFWARSVTELFPSEGPVRAIPLGASSDERNQQAERVGGFLNWQYTVKMPGAYDEWSRLLLRLPMCGSMFTKIYYDHEEETAMVVAVEPSDFIVPYSANDLRTATRYTHRMWLADYIVKGRMESGFYADVPLVFATEAVYPDTRRTIEDAEGREPVLFTEDRRHCILETHCQIAIKSLNAMEGVDDDKALPWILTMDRDSQKLLAVRRNWKEGDPKRKKRLWFSHKRFLPGLGFYGYGFAHIMAGLSRSQSGAIRGLLDAAGLENMGGGFKSKDARVKLDRPLGMGEWREVEASGEELAKAFFPRPTTTPSETLFKLLGYMDEMQQRMAATTETQVGDANNNAPVGTTLALIEQGAKKETAIRQGLHVANAEEFSILAELDAEFLPLVYPYATAEGDHFIFSTDFDDRIDVRPVSDPRLGTQTQRITQMQAVLQLVAQFPTLYNQRNANKRMLEALRVQDIDDLLIKDASAVRQSPVEEGMAMMTGKPVKAFPDQDHAAHRLVHKAWFYSLEPQMQQQLGPVHMAHDAEHAAWEWWVQMQQAMGITLPYPAVMANGEDAGDDQGLPPEVENEIAARAALAVQGMAQMQTQADQQALLQQQAAQQQQAQTQQAQAEQQRASDQQKQDEAFRREQARLDEEARREIERSNAIAQAERDQAAMDSEAERIRQAEEEYPER